MNPVLKLDKNMINTRDVIIIGFQSVETLRRVYRNVEDIDLFVGMLHETKEVRKGFFIYIINNLSIYY